MDQSKAAQYKHVSYLWDDEKAASFGDDQIGLLLYRSNLLGADLRLTNYAGGNTSCKTMEKDPLTGKEVEVMWIKGSGGDIGTLTRSGLAGLYQDRLHSLKNIYRGLQFEDEMVELFNHCIFDLKSKAPSIDTPLHGLLPFKHIDHLHPDALIAIAASKEGEAITKELFDGELAWVNWQRPGFDLGLQLEKALADNPGIRGIVLGGHGLFTWGDTAYESYINTLNTIEKASEYLEANYGKSRPVFGGRVLNDESPERRSEIAGTLAPYLRGLASSKQGMIGHFTDDSRVLEFIGSQDLSKLAPLGTSCPDHFLRTKIRPLVLDFPFELLTGTDQEILAQIEPQFEAYRKDYQAYYDRCKRDNSPAVRDPNPVIILVPGVGMFSFAKDKQTARVAAEFYINAINVMKGAEAISSYVSLPEQEAFDIEYWLLEEAKLQRMPKEKTVSRRVALVTGGSGGIGKAIAAKLLQEGACVVVSDIDDKALAETKAEFDAKFGKDFSETANANVLDPEQIKAAMEKTKLRFGGLDIVVNCAGLSISKPLADTTIKDWDILQDVLVKGQFLVSQEAVAIMRQQGNGGDIINIASKNGLVSGPNNVAYGTAKAAQQHMSRLLAAELGGDKIRVNIVNPDAVISGSKIWESGWAAGRAKAYGIKIEELPAFYAKRTVLGAEIHTEDIANGVYIFVSGMLNKSTGNVINVDGGVPAAFVR
ncbi:rhamnulose-1-phosphate aldolase/alcohol dehydrogenase [Dyadobacter jejuensis]|uniref:Rhamnulose-1-phosphate aldolase/alcohol dehydrogenase n=1 Tax=Dyadobacter jejuensis TaxID=1082580 RepID=A0A316BD46_9BACT|nr:bifunctional aldolase/short-chain dehydrogenase [Dyadobacter jejuensis]PWJ60407.1 rhamnulose-1-phosphate aldolase/alcohol dehydrogenase [Dyadobacter jejuensis]